MRPLLYQGPLSMQARPVRRLSKPLKRLARWLLFLGIVAGVYLLYRWAEPASTVKPLQPMPPDLNGPFYALWQFHLTGNVDLKTRAGDHLQSESLSIMELVNRQTRKTERRMVCDSGAVITLNDIRIQANQLRYDPEART